MRSASAAFSQVVGPDRGGDKDEPFSAAAFCKARSRVDLTFFKRIFDRLVLQFTDRFGKRFRWKGFRLNGIDGTSLNLPANAPELLKKFPCWSGGSGSGISPQALLVALVDLWTGVVRDFVTTSRKVGEGENVAARALVKTLGSEDLLLGDCAFPAYDLCSWIRDRDAHYLFRASTWRFSAARYQRTPLKNPSEYLMELTLPPKVGREHPNLPETLVVRILEHPLKNGQLLRLVTSLLDPDVHPFEELVELYLERWHHETSHREWKHTLKLSNLRSRKISGIEQEICLQLTLNNALRWIQADAIPPEPAKGSPTAPVHLRYRDTLRHILIAASDARDLDPVDLPLLYRELVATVGRLWIEKRPGRSFPRTKPEILRRRRELATSAGPVSHATG